MDSCELEAY